MEKQFVISHLHGQLRTLERLLGNWKPKEETLIVLGDNNDYGPNSFLVYKRLLEIKEEFKERVVFLKGDHELLFEKFYANPAIYADDYFDKGGIATLASFYEKGLSYAQMKDTYYLINEALPQIDFSELTLYLSKCVPVKEAHYSIFLSNEPSILKQQLEKDFNVSTKKKLFLSLMNDGPFKLDYFVKRAREEAVLSGTKEALPLSIKQENGATDMMVLSYNHEETVPIEQKFLPYVAAYRVTNGHLTEKIHVPIEE